MELHTQGRIAGTLHSCAGQELPAPHGHTTSSGWDWFVLATVGRWQHFQRLMRQASQVGVADRMYWLTSQRELWPLVCRADLIVRARIVVHGFGSVAEALYLGCPAVASDVCERPRGTVMFRSRDLDDLVEKCLAVLARSGTAGS